MNKQFRKVKKGLSIILAMSMIFAQMIGIPLTVMAGGPEQVIFYETFATIKSTTTKENALPSGWDQRPFNAPYSGAIKLSATGNTLTTTEFTTLPSEGTLTFETTANAAGTGDGNGSVMLVQEKIGANDWTTAQAITFEKAGGSVGPKTVAVSKEATQIRFNYINKDGWNIGLKNIKLTYIGEALAPSEPVLLESLTLSALNDMEVAASQTINVTYFPEDTTQKGVTWDSSNPAVATITGGKIVAQAGGTTTITATSTKNTAIKVTRELKVTEIVVPEGTVLSGQTMDKKLPAGWVTSEPAEFYAGAPALKMTGWYNLTSPEFKLLSEGKVSFDIVANNTKNNDTGEMYINTSIIKVEQLLPSGWSMAEEIKLNLANKGTITGIATLDSGAIAVRISYQKEGGNIGIDNFVISQAAGVVAIAVTEISLADMEVGTEETKSVSVTYAPTNTTQKWLTWTTADPTIATVDQYGKVTGNKKGTTTIMATSKENINVKGSATITVSDTKAPILAKASPKGSGAMKNATINIILKDDTGLDKDSVEISLDGVDVTKLFTGTIKEGTEEGILSYELSYKPEEGFEEGTYAVKVAAKDTLEFPMSEDWTFSVGEYKQGNLYFGNIHSHTNISDGTGSLEEAYTWARDNAKADYIAITDHSNWFDNDKEGTINNASTSSKWMEALRVSDTFNEDDKFTAMYGYEMTWSNGTGHMNTYNTAGFETRSNGNIDLPEYYRRLLTAPESISQFNHPGTTFGDFKDFGFYTKEMDALITLIEVGNGEGPVRGSGYFPSYEYYTRALDKGWHVSPTNNQDNHKKRWGNANTARTVIEAPALNRDNLYDAMRQRRTYATEDENVEISYTVNAQAMGSLLDNPDTLNLAISVSDPDGDKVSEISIVADGGAVIANKSFSTSQADWNLTLEPEYSYYYVRVTMENGDIAVTAPVWAGETIPVGLSSIEVSSGIVEVGEEFELTTKAFNNTEQTISNLKVEYFKGNLDASNKIGQGTLASLNAAGVAQVQTKVSIQDIGSYNIYATTTFTVKGAVKTSTVSTKVKVLDPEDMLKVVVDGGHYNDYVTGDYPNNMSGFDEILGKKEIKMIINSAVDSAGKFAPKNITDEVLANASLLVLTGPESISGRSRYPYTEEDIAAIVRFAENGGSIIMTSKGDRKNANPGEVDNRNAKVANEVLEALGANLRFNDDLVVDAVTKESETWRLAFKNFNKDPHGLTKGLISGDHYSFYSGCSVSIKEGGDASKVSFPVAIHETTGTVTMNYSDKAVAPAEGTTGNTEVMGVEVLASGAKLIVSGSTFMSNFEVKGDNINANYGFTENVVDWMVQAPEAQLVTIASIHKGYPENFGQRYAIEGIVTAQSEAIEPKNAFFEVIYIQDETGGLTIFGVSQTELKVGQKVRITGTVGEYECDRQIRVVDEAKNLQIIDATVKPVAPKRMTTGESMADHNMGWLVNLTGKVTKMDDMNLWVDDGTGAARAYVNGYIWDGQNPDIKGKWDPAIKVGDTVTVTGLAAKDPDGSRLRIRNTGEIVKVQDQNTETPGGGSSGGGGSAPTPTKPHENAPAETKSDGKGVVTVGTNNITVESKGNVVKATVEKESALRAIEQAVKEAKPNVTPKIIISLPFVKDNNMDVVISAEVIQAAKENKVDIVIGSKGMEYTVPFGALDKADLQVGETIEFSSKEVKNQAVTGKAKNDTLIKLLDLNIFVKSPTGTRKITQFDKPIGIKFSIEGLGDPNRLGIYYVNEIEGTLEFISNEVKDGFIIMRTTHYSQYAIIEKGVEETVVGFSDIINHWAQSSIESIVAKGIAGGYPDGTFKPNNSITRAEFVAMMNSLLKLETVTYEGQFTDVKSSNWFADSIATAAANGLVGGYPDGTFNPNGKITRAEMMSIISEVIKDVTVSTDEIDTILAPFADKNDISPWAKESTAKVVKAGLIGGMDSKIQGKAETTRAQAAAVIDRIINK